MSFFSFHDMVLKVIKLSPDARMPSKAYPGDLGFDLYASVDCEIPPSEQAAVGTGITVEMPEGWGGILKDRSSMALKRIYISAGVIDQGYRGEIKALLRNESQVTYKIRRGDKIAQMVPVQVTDWTVMETSGLKDTDRDANGFGSSGK